MNRRVLIPAIVLVAVASGAGGYSYWKAKHPAAPKKEQAAEAPPLAPGALVKFQATLRAHNVVGVDVPVDGILEEFPVKPGDEVVEGQILGSIKNDLLVENEKEAALELERLKSRMATLESQLLATRLEESKQSADASRATSDRQRAERAYQRQQMLHREGATPRKAFEAAQAAYDTAKEEESSLAAVARSQRDRMTQITQDLDAAKRLVAEAEAEYDQAKAGLIAAQLLSPVDGLVIAIQKQAGEEVKAGMEGLIQVAVDLTMMEAVAQLDPALVDRIVAGMPAEVLVAELTGSLPGQVRLVENGKAHVEFASPSPLVRPGMTATVTLQLK
jgi:multidrug resistance efflux pump